MINYKLEITTTPLMVKGEEGREKGKTASPNSGHVGFTLPPFTLLSSPL
jgi:hypothetical protein